MTIVLDKKLIRNSAYILMVNLALSDMGISTLVHIFTIIGMLALKFHKFIE